MKASLVNSVRIHIHRLCSVPPESPEEHRRNGLYEPSTSLCTPLEVSVIRAYPPLFCAPHALLAGENTVHPSTSGCTVEASAALVLSSILLPPCLSTTLTDHILHSVLSSVSSLNPELHIGWSVDSELKGRECVSFTLISCML